MATSSTVLVSTTPSQNPLAQGMYGFKDPTSQNFAPGYVGLQIETLTVQTVALDGTDATAVTPPAGGVGIRGWLSGIYSRLGGTLAVAGTFWQATQPISAASLPLPSNAAQETGGNLAAILAALGANLKVVLQAGSAAIGSVTIGAGAAVIGAVTQSGAWVLSAGAAIIGKVGIDQTTPGATNATAPGVIDSTGNMCFPDRYSHALTYNADGTVATDVFTDGSHTWTTTYGYASGLATSISNWVRT